MSRSSVELSSDPSESASASVKVTSVELLEGGNYEVDNSDNSDNSDDSDPDFFTGEDMNEYSDDDDAAMVAMIVDGDSTSGMNNQK